MYFNEQALAEYFNMQPSMVKGTANRATDYYKRYLYTMVYSVFKFKLPKEWALNYFRFWLFHYGSISVIYTKELGWIASPYGISKVDWQYQPKAITVTNPYLKESKTGVIGHNADIIRIMDDFRGLDDLVTDYAVKLAQIDKTVNINLMNANVTKAFSAEDKKQAEEIKDAYERATTGEPLVVVNKKVMNKDSGLVNMFGSVKNDFVADQLLLVKRQLVNEFLTRIGIKNANYDKKERLNSAEVEQNNDETQSIISIIYENLQDGIEKVNKISNLGLSVEMRYNYDEGGLQDDEIYALRTP